MQEENVQYAGFWIRLVAYLLDIAIISCISILLYALISPEPLPGSDGSDVWIQIILYGVFFVYFVAFISLYSATPGKMLFRLKILREGSLEKISFLRTVGRFFAYIVSGFFFIGFAMIGLDKKKQGLHDSIAKTVVVRVPRRQKEAVLRSEEASISRRTSPLSSKLIAVVSIILILGGGLFYWFQLRPSNIKKQCSVVTVQEHCSGSGIKPVDCHYYQNSDPNEVLQANDNEYEGCLRKSGL